MRDVHIHALHTQVLEDGDLLHVDARGRTHVFNVHAVPANNLARANLSDLEVKRVGRKIEAEVESVMKVRRRRGFGAFSPAGRRRNRTAGGNRTGEAGAVPGTPESSPRVGGTRPHGLQ